MSCPNIGKTFTKRFKLCERPTKARLDEPTENVKELGNVLATADTPITPPSKSAGRTTPDPSHAAPVQLVKEPSNELQYLRDIAQPFLAPIGETGMVLIFTVFLLIEHDDIRNRLLRLAGLHRLGVMTQAFDDATRRVGRYLMLQFLVNACFGLLCGLGLYFIGVPYAALWGAVAAILRIVPYVGALVAGLLPFILSLAVFNSWLQPALVLSMFVVIEIVTANFIEPLLYGAHTGISSLALLVTTVFWTAVWGPAGLILSTPLTVCLVVIGRHVPQFSFLHILLGDEPALVSEAQLYQRLLASDDHGARAILNAHPSKDSVCGLYDSVMLPALALMERDRNKGTLDAEREEHVFWNMREIIDEVGKDAQRSTESAPQQGRVFCIPATHESEEIAAGMLRQVLYAVGYETIVVPRDAGLQYLNRSTSPAEGDVVFVSTLPPLALTRARAIVGRLRRRFPKAKLIVGVWGFTGDAARARERLAPFSPDEVVSTLAAAIACVQPAKAEETVSSYS